MRQVIFSVTHADPQVRVKLTGLPDLPATTLTDLYHGTAYVDRKGTHLPMLFRTMTSVRLQRETNYDLPQRPYMHIRYVIVDMGRPAMSAWLGRLLQSQYSIHTKHTHESTRKKIYETDCITKDLNENLHSEDNSLDVIIMLKYILNK
jgi:hypothetical protein